eukprot:4241591-Heterocapsa_arctica.AAC.1
MRGRQAASVGHVTSSTSATTPSRKRKGASVLRQSMIVDPTACKPWMLVEWCCEKNSRLSE